MSHFNTCTTQHGIKDVKTSLISLLLFIALHVLPQCCIIKYRYEIN